MNERLPVSTERPDLSRDKKPANTTENIQPLLQSTDEHIKTILEYYRGRETHSC